MALPYDPTLILDLFPNSSMRKQIGASPALDPNSATKGAWLASLLGLGGSDRTPGSWFPGVSSMNYNATVFDDEAGATVAPIVNRSTGSTYPDGQAFNMPAAAKGIDEGAGSNNDSHCLVINWADGVVLQMRQFYGGPGGGNLTNGGAAACYSGGVSPIDGEAAIWMVPEASWTLSGAGAPGSGSNGQPGTGSGINYADCIVYPEEFEHFLATGQVLCGMRCVLPTSRVSTGVVPPAWKTDGAETPSSQTMKEGQRFYLATTPSEIAAITDNAGSTTSRIARWGQFIAWKLYLFGARIEDRTTGNIHFSAVHRQSWEMLGNANKWASSTVFNGAAVSPAAAMQLVRNFPVTFAVLSESFQPPGGAPANVPPVASFTISPAQEIETGATITLTSTSTDSDGTIAALAWDLDNDGSFDDGTTSPITTSFGTPGTKTVRLRATDDDGATHIATHQVVIADTPAANQLPVADFTIVPSTALVGELVTFDAAPSTDPDGTIAAWAWDIDGDGDFDEALTGPVQSFPFVSSGTKTVRLRVTDNDGGQNIATKQIIISPLPVGDPPLAATSLTVSANGLVVTAELDIPRDDRRDSVLGLRRAGAPGDDTWNATPAYTAAFSNGSPGVYSGSPLVGPLFDLRPGVDEIKGVRVRVPAAGVYDIWSYLGGGGTGGSGTATIRALGFPLAANLLPDGQARFFIGDQLSIAWADPVIWRRVASPSFPSAGDYVVFLIVGGSTRAAQISRVDPINYTDGFGGEFYVDSGITYASPPTTCPTTLRGSQRASIYALITPGGSKSGGRFSISFNVPAPGTYYIDAYTSKSPTDPGPDGIFSPDEYLTARLSASPYPLEISGSTPPEDPPEDPGEDPENPAPGSLLEGIDNAIDAVQSVLTEKLAGLEGARVAEDTDLLDLTASEVQFTTQALRELDHARALAEEI